MWWLVAAASLATVIFALLWLKAKAERKAAETDRDAWARTLETVKSERAAEVKDYEREIKGLRAQLAAKDARALEGIDELGKAAKALELSGRTDLATELLNRLLARVLEVSAPAATDRDPQDLPLPPAGET